MADQDVHSKGHESDDERSVTISQDSKSTHTSERSHGSEARKPCENRPSKGGKALAALRNPRHDQLIKEYKTQYPKPESTDDEMSIRSLQQENDSSISQQIAPIQSPEHDMVIDEFKKYCQSENHRSDSDKTISEASHSDDEDERKGAVRVIQEPPESDKESRDYKKESDTESLSEKSDTSSDTNRGVVRKMVKPEKSSTPQKVLQREREVNEGEVGQKPIRHPVTFAPSPPVILDSDHEVQHKDTHKTNDSNSRHPPPIHIDYGDRQPTKEDKMSEQSSTDEDEDEREDERQLSKEEKHDGKVAGVEFEKQKPIHKIAEMFGGSVVHERAEVAENDDDELVMKEHSSKGKHNVPPVAAKYVEAVNATSVIKNRTSAYEELNFNDDSHKETEDGKEEELNTETKPNEDRLLTEDERYMSVRVVRNVREYVEKHDRDTALLIKMLGHEKKAKLYDNKKTEHHKSTTHEPMTKETGVQVHIDEPSKEIDSTRHHGSKSTHKRDNVKHEKKSSKGTHRRSTMEKSNEENDDAVENKSEETQTEDNESVDEEPKYHVKITPVAQRRQIFEAAAAANASSH